MIEKKMFYYITLYHKEEKIISYDWCNRKGESIQLAEQREQSALDKIKRIMSLIVIDKVVVNITDFTNGDEVDFIFE